MRLERSSYFSRRILAMVAGIVVAMTVSFFFYFVLELRNTIDTSLNDEGLAIASSVSGASSSSLESGDHAFLESYYESISHYPDLVFIAVYDLEGNIIHQASDIVVYLPRPKQEIIATVFKGTTFRGDRIRLGDLSVDVFYAPIRSLSVVSSGVAGQGAIIGFVRLGFSRAKIQALERNSIYFLLTIGSVVMAVSILLASILSRRITGPLRQLEQVTRRIADGDYDIQIPIRSQDEVGALARAFNAMAIALRETTVSKDYVDNIVASMNDALIVISPERTIATVNQAARKMLEFDITDLEACPFEKLFSVPLPLSPVDWETLERGEAIQGCEAIFLTKGNQQVPISLSVSPIFDRQWRFRGAVAVARDMRDLQRLLDELRRHTANLEEHRQVLTSMLEDNQRTRAIAEAERQKEKAAVDAMAEGVILFGGDGTLALINPAARRMLQVGDEKRVDTRRIAQALNADFGSFFDARDEIGNRFVQEIVIGEVVPHTIQVEGMPVVGAKKDRVGALIVLRDITRERQLDEAKHELITNVSHELRTPLAAISNIVSNILVGVTGPITDKLSSHLEIARINAKRLANIIDNLLDIASLDAGRVTIWRKLEDLNDIIRGVVHLIAPEMEQKLIRFDLQIPPGSLRVYCDANAIGQVTKNLLNNAIRYTPQGGHIALLMEQTNNTVQIAVEDSGIGISPEDQKSIFDRFHQVGRVYGPGEKGLGLGLPISRRLVEAHGGSMGVTSASGVGSRFYFRLPAPSGRALIAIALADMLSSMQVMAVLPSLWILIPHPPVGEVVLSEEASSVALEHIASGVREILKDVKPLVTVDTEKGEVDAVVILQEEKEMQQILEWLDAQIRHVRFQRGKAMMEVDVAIGYGLCRDPTGTPELYFETVRKAVS